MFPDLIFQIKAILKLLYLMYYWVFYKVQVERTTRTCGLVIGRDAVVADTLLRVSFVIGDSVCRRAGHSRDVRQAAGGRVGQRGAATVQQELPVIDDSGSCRAKSRAEISSVGH